MAYLQLLMAQWPINKDYQGKTWESALPREELRAKYRNLPGHQIMQILDGELEFDNLDKEHSKRKDPKNTVLALTGSNTNKWKSVKETLPWHTNSWK